MTEVEMRDLLGHLNDRERYVVEARTFQGKTLATIGEALGVTRERVRQIENGGLKKMRGLLREREKAPVVSKEFVAQTQRQAQRQELLHRTKRARKWAASIGRSFNVAHYVIAAPGKERRAIDALTKAGIDAKTFPAIMAGELSDALAQIPYHRFGGGTIARTPAQHGAWLSHMALVAMGRALGVEWLGVWEDDCGAGDQIGWRELKLPLNCGVVYLGGILWGSPEDYGEHMGEGLWRVTQARPISGTHAVMIHRRAMDDVLAAYARADMTEDDLLSCACIEAIACGSWSTCFVQPWLAWQVDRRETWSSDASC